MFKLSSYVTKHVKTLEFCVHDTRHFSKENQKDDLVSCMFGGATSRTSLS